MAKTSTPKPAAKIPAQPPTTKKGTPRKRAAMPGAGRPKGSKGKKSLSAALRIMEGNLREAHRGGPLPDNTTPLDVMVSAMRTAHKVGGPLAAFPYAKEAAPFMHPKMASVEWRAPGDDKGPPRLIVEFVTAHKPAKAPTKP